MVETRFVDKREREQKRKDEVGEVEIMMAGSEEV